MVCSSIAKAQYKQNLQYDKNAKAPSYKISDRVLMYMPHEATEKNRKLALPYQGPYRIININNDYLLLRPLDSLRTNQF